MPAFELKIDAAALKELQERLIKITDEQLKLLMEDCLRSLASRLLEKVVKRTPVGIGLKRPEKNKRYIKYTTEKTKGKKAKTYTFMTAEEARFQKYWAGYEGGTLRRNWEIGALTRKRHGDGVLYEIEISNPTMYAPYVEFGHRQTPGRYVPALGKQLKSAWVKGRFMLTISLKEMQEEAPKLLKTRQDAFLRDILK